MADKKDGIESLKKYRVKTREELAANQRNRPVAKQGLNPNVRGNPTLDAKSQSIGEMGFSPDMLAEVPQSLMDVRVSDLEDFARKMVGFDVRNPRVNALTIEEIQGIEALFADTKEQTLATIAGRLGPEMTSIGGLGVANVDVSCCCCTPCCCCAATETNPFADAS
jgi:hypothetical protein